LPRFDSIGVQPPPDGDPANGGSNTLFHDVSLEVFPAESRQRYTQPSWQLACQRFNCYYNSGGKTGRAARILVDRSAHPAASRKIVFATYSRFDGVDQTWQQFDHSRALARPRELSWHEPQRSMAPYTSAPCPQAFPAPSLLIQSNRDFSLAYCPPHMKKTMPKRYH
jgi:hypothetical protein